MRLSDLEKHVGEVVILDLINGAQVTTEIKEIIPDESDQEIPADASVVLEFSPSKHWVRVGKLLVFQVSAEIRDPRQPPHPIENPVEHKVRNGSYGFPLVEIEDEKVLDIDHILMVHPCQDDMVRVYMHVTTGIEIAPAGALNAIDAANKGKIALK